MKIAVIGTGTVGSALARGFSRAGHDVILGSRRPEDEEVRALAAETGAAAARPEEAAARAEAVVLAVPWAAARAAVEGLGDLGGKILVDATNPLGPGLALVADPSGGELVARWAGGARVVKAFNSIGAEVMARADRFDPPPVLFLAGDDGDAKETVALLAAELGFDPVDAGPLQRSRHLEHLAVLWIHRAIATGNRRFGLALTQG